MRLERLTYNKIKVFLTFDDLLERGLTKEDLWHDAPKVQQLFRDMMDEASLELGFEADGPIAVEVFSLQAQGMVVIVTKETADYEDSDEFLDEYIEMQVTLDESYDIFYEFNTFEDVLSLAKRMFALDITGGSLYSYQQKYYLLFEDNEFGDKNVDNMIALLAEFGNPATVTTYRVNEYGKELMKEQALTQINKYF
ncbi:adapter protein MecA 1/2 [Bacillus mesophilus]|uniref:Adapter protein MecA n=1 Tax=Bacillus mesophilus TaxID=1808955 RepID=A0A6M0Q8B0_9BACI|nr:genetic competence negative regulator [Bacillus mesophilus]MBM7661217.1 adapter protein MecA 1/2 [Bacillus mesophilus]NEY71258.1 genetic competence negative regulator [Bacillus mesophilus]